LNFLDSGLIVSMFAMKGRRSFSSTSTRKADITLTVDGKEVSVPQGATPVQQHVPIPISGSLYRLRIDPGV
jgi:hypothetical protein